MLKKVVWRDGDVYSVKLREDLYTLVQMRISPYLTFFGVSTRDGSWQGIDLNQATELFTAPVALARVKSLFESKPDPQAVVPTSAPMPKKFINASLNFAGGYPFQGGSLIEIDDRGETTGRPILQANLSADRDSDTIRCYELTNMWVDPAKLSARLVRYFDTGVNWDPHKEKVFPGISAPAP